MMCVCIERGGEKLEKQGGGDGQWSGHPPQAGQASPPPFLSCQINLSPRFITHHFIIPDFVYLLSHILYLVFKTSDFLFEMLGPKLFRIFFR